MKVLITGGGGFIGSNLARALVERGDAVRVLDNFSTGNRAETPASSRGSRRKTPIRFRRTACRSSQLRRSVERDDKPERAGDVRDSWADVTRARELLGWEPRIGLDEGLRLAADAFLQRVA